jgi:sulfonate transport system substrate-binding protein
MLVGAKLRKLALGAFMGFAALTLSDQSSSAADAKVIHVGIQKYGALVILRATGALEKALAPLGIKVQWTEFPGGPQLLEALNVGSIDFGNTGEAPPVFAQAAGAPLFYVGVEPPAPDGEAILVPAGSPIKTVAELKGKRVALNKGSNVHFLLVQALATANLTPADINSVFLAPADGRAAFESGSVDAWAIWDPFLAAAQAQTGGKVLVDGTNLAPNVQFYLASKDLALTRTALLHTVLDTIKQTDAWASTHQSEVADALTVSTGLPKPILLTALKRLTYGVTPLDDATVARQQKMADSFFALHLIPKALTVRDAVFVVPASL